MFGGLHSPHPLPSAEALVEIARAFTPRVEALGATPVLLDLHGLGRAWPDPVSLGTALLEKARAHAAFPHVALAFTRTAALVLARAQPGLTIVPPGREAESLAPLPLTALELDPERAELLRRWGLRRLGDLARLPARGLAERFGPDGPLLRRLARGEDATPLVPTPAAERFETALELEWPVDGLEPLSFLLGRVLEPLCAGLAARGRRATGMELELALVDGGTHRRALRTTAATAEPRTWRTLLLLDLEAHPPHDAIRALLVRADPTPARTTQFSLLDPALPSPERLAETLGRLHEWTAAGKGGAAALLDTHRPGAFLVGSFAPGPLERRRAEARGGVPAPHLALRAFRPPLLAEVALEGGSPRFVEAPGVRGAVLDRAGPWRASGDWWDVAWSREEWDVALAGGGLYRIYRDRLREQWFVEGELD
jgi:protein ImuB